jgi:hypothetical protein
MPHKLNADARTGLAQYVMIVFRLRSEFAERVAGSQEAIIQSRELMAKLDAHTTPPGGWLWPSY